MTAATMLKELASVMDHEPVVYPRQSHYFYPQGVQNPRQDAEFIDAIANLLIVNRGKRVHVQAVLGGDPWIIGEHIETLRAKYGLVIEGERGKVGYTFKRFRHVRKEPEPESPGQMRILFPRRHARISGQTAMGGAG